MLLRTGRSGLRGKGAFCQYYDYVEKSFAPGAFVYTNMSSALGVDIQQSVAALSPTLILQRGVLGHVNEVLCLPAGEN